MHKWVMKQATTQVGNEMLQKEIMKAYESKIRAEMENKIMEAAHQVERQVEHQIKHMEDMSSSELDKLREKRVKQMKKDALRRKRWESKGRGGYDLMAESAFFEMVNKHSRIVVHFAREATERCRILDRHLKDIAARHIETMFVKVDAEKSPFLSQRLGIKVLPCMKLIKQGEVIKTLLGFEEFGSRDDFKTAELVQCLARIGMIEVAGGMASGMPGIHDSQGNLSSDEDHELYDDGGR